MMSNILVKRLYRAEYARLKKDVEFIYCNSSQERARSCDAVNDKRPMVQTIPGHASSSGVICPRRV